MSRKLDAAVAEALGRKVELKNLGEYGVNLFYQVSQTDKTSPFAVVPRYSTDGNDMLELDKEMRARGWVSYTTWEYHSQKFLSVMLNVIDVTKKTARAKEDEEPLTRALAAYKALTGKEWSE